MSAEVGTGETFERPLSPLCRLKIVRRRRELGDYYLRNGSNSSLNRKGAPYFIQWVPLPCTPLKCNVDEWQHRVESTVTSCLLGKD